MNKEDVLTKQIITLEIIQTIIRHSDDNYLLHVALTHKLKELLGCKLVVFINYNIFSEKKDIVSIEVSQFEGSRNQLEDDLKRIIKELQEMESCEEVEFFHPELLSFKQYSKALLVPVRNNENNIGIIILFDIIQLYDHKVVQQSIESAVPYIATVLYNSICYHQLEHIINARTIELKQALEKVNESVRSKSMFIANMSHEMRTPLNGILGFVDLLILSEDDTKKIDYLTKIKRASRSLLYLISEVLDFSKLDFESIELYEQPFDLLLAIEDIISLHQGKAGKKGIDLYIQSKGFPNLKVIGDVERFNQILSNLISNAIKFTDKGSVVINVESCIEDVVVDDVLIEKHLKLICDVTDTGIGIHQENLKRIFGVFTQEDVSTTRKYGGTGLGLSIAKRLIELMDGKIKVESVPGEGSIFSFYVYFGLMEDDNINPVKSKKELFLPLEINPLRNSPLNILVVEDNELNENLIGEILKFKSIVPDFAQNGKEAIDLSIQKFYDLILMDCQMPFMDGFSATKEIRAYYKSLDKPYIIALTAAVTEEDKQKCFEAGMNDFLAKPIDMKSILSIIDRFSENNLT